LEKTGRYLFKQISKPKKEKGEGNRKRRGVGGNLSAALPRERKKDRLAGGEEKERNLYKKHERGRRRERKRRTIIIDGGGEER